MLATPLALCALLLGSQAPDPTSEFDWTIASGQVFTFSTVSQTIVSSPPQFQQVALNGIVSVRNFTIELGGRLVVQGPNPMLICASGQVVIDGKLSIDGSSSLGVIRLNSTKIPEVGAVGQGGGGRGGTGSPLTSASSPVGGNGFGAFGVPDAGGQGGEAGWSLGASVNLRRGAGGGGGVFGANQKTPLKGVGTFNQSVIGLDAEPGFDNKSAANGALSGPGPALGGAPGPGPFLDGSKQNDFFGTMFVGETGGGEAGIGETSSGKSSAAARPFVLGELRQPWAGAGGGAGGDANRPKNSATYPGSWSIAGDEKGAGGGGGAGSLRILSLGPILFGPSGEITANGGNGGTGESTIFLNRVGGGSGGGSGGHIILETADHIDLTQALGPAVRALGGQGGGGINGLGGAVLKTSGSKQTKPRKDACPDGYPTVAPNQCLGHVNGAGGDGGPGLIQFHTPGGAADILLAPGLRLSDMTQPRSVCWPGNCYLLVSFDSDEPVVRAPDETLTSGPLESPERLSIEALRISRAR